MACPEVCSAPATVSALVDCMNAVEGLGISPEVNNAEYTWHVASCLNEFALPETVQCEDHGAEYLVSCAAREAGYTWIPDTSAFPPIPAPGTDPEKVQAMTFLGIAGVLVLWALSQTR